MSRTLPSPPTKTLPTPTDTLSTTELDLFLTCTSSYTPTNPHLSTENLQTPTSMSATIHVPPLSPKTVSSDPLQDELTSYAPPNTYKMNWTQSTQPPYKMNTSLTESNASWTLDSVKQKLENPNKLTLKQFNRQPKATTPSLTASFPFHPYTITKKIKKSLASHDVKVTSSSGTTLRDLLTKTKTTPPPHLTPNVIYEISFNDCTATYNGQTNRPLIKRIKKHESHSKLHLHNPDDFSHNQSAPAHHSRTTGHKIAWDRTTILATTRYKTQLDLTEHTAIKIRNPSLNCTDSAPTAYMQ